MTLSERHYVGGGIVLLTAVASALAYPDLPAEMVTHWGTEGPNDTMDRAVALTFLPALAAGIFLLFEVLPRLDPLGEHITDLGRYYDLLVVVVVGLLGYVHGLVILWNLGYDFAMVQAITPAVAVVYYVVGGVLERVEKNWFVGIRTPWTLSSDEVWEKTHERGAPLFKLAALVALAAVLVPEYAVYLLVVPVAMAALYLTVYSYVAYSRLESGSEDRPSV